MWAPLAVDLARDHTVVVPDLRGMGLSSKPKGGFDKKNQAEDVDGVLAALGVQQADVVAHDIGNMLSKPTRPQAMSFVPSCGRK